MLSKFASTDAVEFLVTVLESPAVVPAVRDEIGQGRNFGHGYLDTAADVFGEDDYLPDADRIADGIERALE